MCQLRGCATDTAEKGMAVVAVTEANRLLANYHVGP